MYNDQYGMTKYEEYERRFDIDFISLIPRLSIDLNI